MEGCRCPRNGPGEMLFLCRSCGEISLEQVFGGVLSARRDEIDVHDQIGIERRN